MTRAYSAPLCLTADYMDGLVKLCSDNNIRCLENEPLSKYISFKVGGPCRAMVFPNSAEKAALVIKYLSEREIKRFIMGNGTNLLFADEGYDGVIINTSDYNEIKAEEENIYAFGGAPLIKLCRLALDNSLSGLEFAYGIPGSAGGAAYMNAGAYNGEMKDVIAYCDYIDSDLTVRRAYSDELSLSYRKSAFNDTDKFILNVALKLKKGDKDEIKAKMDDLLSRRKDKQPLEYPSAGSTFKRPEGYFAGALIEQCGLKGRSVGGAQVSEKHAGFIINKGGASADDILKLIELCQNEVLKKTGVTLEPEVKIIK